MTPVLATAFRRPSTLPLIQFTEIQKTTLSKPEGETAPELDAWYVWIYSSGIHILLKKMWHTKWSKLVKRTLTPVKLCYKFSESWDKYKNCQTLKKHPSLTSNSKSWRTKKGLVNGTKIFTTIQRKFYFLPVCLLLVCREPPAAQYVTEVQHNR